MAERIRIYNLQFGNRQEAAAEPLQAVEVALPLRELRITETAHLRIHLDDATKLKQGQLCHRLIGILTADFYRPIRTAEIFDKITPDQYFNPVTSPAIVHQALHRLRKQCRKNSWPLSIRETPYGFHLVAQEKIAIKVGRHESYDGESMRLSHCRKILRKFYDSRGGFSRSDAESILSLERCTTLRTLKNF